MDSICLLDATYKARKYAVPFFFVVLKTNVDYQVVASFALRDETAAALTLRPFVCFKVLESFVAAKLFHGRQLRRGNQFYLPSFSEGLDTFVLYFVSFSPKIVGINYSCVKYELSTI